MRYEDQRQRLVEELRLQGIRDEAVLQAFLAVPRELYVLPEYREYAYRNQPLPIDCNQTISQPLMIAIMLEHMQLTKSDLVLEIGTGSGYQTALLAALVREVCTVERLEALSLSARAVLKEAGCANIHYRIGDGSQGWQHAFPPYKSFNKIIVSAAAAHVPSKLVEQLAEPGILVIPVGPAYLQTLVRVEKKDGKIHQSSHGGCTFVPLVENGQ